MAWIDGSTKGVTVIKDGKSIEITEVRTVKGGVFTTVWSKGSSESFYWMKDGVVQDGFPSDYGNYSLTPSGAFEYRIGLTDAHVYGHTQNSNTQFTGETIAVSTKGNRYMEVVVASVDNRGVLNSFLVAGTEYKDQVSNGAVITVDVSSMSEVTLKLVMTAWAGGNHMGLSIKSIRFYS